MKKCLLYLPILVLIAWLLLPVAMAEEDGIVALPEDGIVVPPADKVVPELEDEGLPTCSTEAGLSREARMPDGRAAGALKAAQDDIPIDNDHFPDNAFREYVGEFDGDGNGILSYDERSHVRAISVSNCGISSLAGIEWFPSLDNLDCSDNRLTALDVSGLSTLRTLDCTNNQLAALEVNGCTGMEKLVCKGNQLTALETSGCTSLVYLNCCDNQLKELGARDCSGLLQLICYNNQLKTLDVSENAEMKWIYCFNNRLTSLDISGCTALEELYCYHNQLTSLDVKGCAALCVLYCYGNQLSSLDVGGCTAIQFLNCSDNRLSMLDVSGCTALFQLDCSKNLISGIDLTKCKNLIVYAMEAPVMLSDGTVGFGENHVPGAGLYYIHIDAITSIVIDGQVVFSIVESLEGAKISVEDQVYTGKALKPEVVVTLKGVTLIEGTDYTVAYRNNRKVGKATVTVTGKGLYRDKAKASFKINPKAVTGLKLVAGKKQLAVSWKKVAGVGGYQIQYGTKKSFKGAKTASVSGAATLKKVLKKLASGKTYYVRIRAWQKVGGKTYRSAWSGAVKAKVK